MNKNRPLNILLNQIEFSSFVKRNNDPRFFKLRDKIFQRDNYICWYCGFQANKYMFIANISQKYGGKENRASNLVTACPFCIQCHFVAEVGSSFGGGFLIALPEMTQNLLNSFCHVLFCAIENNTGLKSSALHFYRSLKSRALLVDEQLAPDASNPISFSNMILEGSLDKKIDEIKKVHSMRLLPSRAAFAKETHEWSEEALKEISE